MVLHISHDAWVEDEKQDIPMRQLSDKEVGSAHTSETMRYPACCSKCMAQCCMDDQR